MWSLLSNVATSILYVERYLIQCGCRTALLCTKDGKCHYVGLPCIAVCHCDGSCSVLNYYKVPYKGKIVQLNGLYTGVKT